MRVGAACRGRKPQLKAICVTTLHRNVAQMPRLEASEADLRSRCDIGLAQHCRFLAALMVRPECFLCCRDLVTVSPVSCRRTFEDGTPRQANLSDPFNWATAGQGIDKRANNVAALFSQHECRDHLVTAIIAHACRLVLLHRISCGLGSGLQTLDSFPPVLSATSWGCAPISTTESHPCVDDIGRS